MFKHLHPANSYPQANRCPRQLLHELLYLPGALLTNRHVALPWEDDASAEALGEQGIEPVLIKFIGYLPETNDPFPVKILRASDGAELAVLLCEGVTGGIPHLRLGNTSPKKDRHFSATRTGWSKGSGVCDDFMKLRLSSSGCETRPARGEPTRVGSEPCDGSGNAPGDA